MASLAEWPTTPYLNPFFNALFFTPDPSPAVKKIRTYLLDPSRFTRNVLVVPPCSLIWALDAETRQTFWNLIHTNEDFLASHILIIPSGAKSTERSRRMQTFNNKTVFAYKSYVQTNMGFKYHYNAKITKEYIYTPSSPYFPNDAQFLVYEVAFPLVGRPTYPTLNTKSPNDAEASASSSNPLASLTSSTSVLSSAPTADQSTVLQQKFFSSQILEPPEYFGVDIEKIKSDVRIRRDYKLLPIIYTKDISKVDLDLLHLINTFSIDAIHTKEELVDHYNKTVDQAISIFSSMGPNVLNKIINETDLSSQELGQMVGEHIEAQIHLSLWEKTQQIFQVQDAKISDLCWAMKHISIEHLGIPVDDMTTLFDLDDLVGQSVKLFSSLSTIIGASDKTKVLLSVIQILSNGTPSSSDKEALQRATKCSVHYNLELSNDKSYNKLKNAMSADILVSLMILVVVRSDMVNISSLLFYIRNFSFDDTEMGQVGYALSTLEAVAYHIENNHKKMTALSQLNKRFFTALNAAGQLQRSERSEESLDSDHNTTPSESPAVVEISKFIGHLIRTQPDQWKSIVRSRSPTGTSALVSSITEIRRIDPATGLDLLNFFFDLIDPDTKEFVFDTNYVIGDRDNSGFSLFILALECEDEDFIFSVLSKIDELDDTHMARYFSRVNNWKRSVGHYIFHAHTLIPKIGHLIDWEVKDLAGQTPLFALFRCYDHQHYDELVEMGFRAWEQKSLSEKSKESQTPNAGDFKSELDLMIHRDPKDNTLLHIVKDQKALKILLAYNVDTNWPNELGFTPLMTYAKYSRLEAIKELLKDKRVDIHVQNDGGTTALEIAKEPETLRYLESAYLPFVDEKSVQNSGYHHSSSILHTSLSRGRLYFIITSGVPFDPSSLTSVCRTFEDFKFLAKWLGYENPYSWVPPVELLSGPKILHGNTVYQLFNDVQIRLNVFLRALTMHPTFANHELLWEFVLVQDIEKESVIERCRRKLQNQQEYQIEKEEWWGSSFHGTTSKSRSSSISSPSDRQITNDEKKSDEPRVNPPAQNSSDPMRKSSITTSLPILNGEAVSEVLNPIKSVTKKVSLRNILGGRASNSTNTPESSDVDSQSLVVPKPSNIPIPSNNTNLNYSLALPRSPTVGSNNQHNRDVSIGSTRSTSSSSSSNIFFFRANDLEPIHYFIQYAHEQLTKLASSTQKMCEGMQRITTTIDSCNQSVEMAMDIARKLNLVNDSLTSSFHPKPVPLFAKYSSSIDEKAKDTKTNVSEVDFQYLQKAALLGSKISSVPYSDFSVGLHALSTVVSSASATLETPIGLIHQLKDREMTLSALHRTLEKTSGKNIWPLGIFEEKRVKDINDANDKIYLCQNEINRISTDIHRYHETLASEIGALYTIHEEELKRQIGRFVGRVIQDGKTRLKRLEEVQKVVGRPEKRKKKSWVGVSMSSPSWRNSTDSSNLDKIISHNSNESVNSELDDLRNNSYKPSDTDIYNTSAESGSMLVDIDSEIDLPSLVASSTHNQTIDQIPSIPEEGIPSIEVSKHGASDDDDADDEDAADTHSAYFPSEEAEVEEQAEELLDKKLDHITPFEFMGSASNEYGDDDEN